MFKRVKEFDRIVECELRSGTDREVRGMKRISDKNNIIEMPMLVFYKQKVKPLRIIIEQRIPFQVVGEYHFEILPAFRLLHFIETSIAPCRVIAFYNEG